MVLALIDSISNTETISLTPSLLNTYTQKVLINRIFLPFSLLAGS